MPLPLSRVAYHEAGHAAAALAFGMEFESVTSEAEPGGPAGCLQMLPGQETRGDFPYVCLTAGGIIADRIKRGRDDFTPGTIRNWHRYGWLEPDIRILITEFPDRQRLLTLVQQAVSFTRVLWPAVGAIAQALMPARTLTYDEAQAIYARADLAGSDRP